MGKPLKVLIFDSCPPQNLAIEKFLNYLGCYGVAPIFSLDEFRSFVDFSRAHFNLLILNSHMLGDFEKLEFACNHSRNMSNVLIYNHVETCFSYSKTHLFATFSGFPEVAFLDCVLTLIESRG